MGVGPMDREITLQTATRSTDATTGETVLTWDSADDETLWAEWLPGSTREGWRARQIDSSIEGVYRIHARDEPVPDLNRIIGHDGRTFDVKPCTEVGRGMGWLVPVVARGESA